MPETPRDPATLAAAVDVVRLELPQWPIDAIGPVLEVTFPAANTPRDLAHGLLAAPDGYLVVLQSNGLVQAVDVHLWTSRVAWLQATTANTRARVIFYRLQQGAIIHVVPS